MKRPPQGEKTKLRRIALILRIQALLFEDPVYGFRHAASMEFEKLLSMDFAPEASDLKRLLSMIRSYELMVGKPQTEKDEALHTQLADLSRHLGKLLKALPPKVKKPGAPEDLVPKPAPLIKENLGSSFIKRGCGMPLFGYYRPKAVPKEEGILLCFETPDKDGMGRLDAVWKDGATDIEYRDVGISLSSSASWLYCSIAPASSKPEPAPLAGLETRGNEPERFFYNNCTVSLARMKVKHRFRGRIFTPNLSRYVYFFPAGERTALNFERFLKDIYTARFGVPMQDAKRLAFSFKERLLL